MGISVETLAAANEYTNKAVGSISELKTENKTDIVAAINELFDILHDNEFIVSATGDSNKGE